MQISNASYDSSRLINRYQAQTKPQSAEGEAKAAPDKSKTQSVDPRLQSEIQALKNRDREVRSHEQAHVSAAGGIAVSGASFQFVTGPDGQRYAVGGEVSIDTSAVANDPVATLRKAETIRRAALAPAQPSAQDYSVAGKATAMANQASVDMLRTLQGAEHTSSQLDVMA